LRSAEEAALWAKQAIGSKNKLSAPDATQIEEAFASRLTSLIAEGAAVNGAPLKEDLEPPGETSSPGGTIPVERQAALSAKQKPIDKSQLAFPEPRRIRDKDHLRFVAGQPCLVCGRKPSDAHHLRFTQPRALARKVSDEFTVPLCRGHHREVHRRADETAWWSKLGIEPTVSARTLWLTTHPLPAERAVVANAAAAGSRRRRGQAVKPKSRPGRRPTNYKTKPIVSPAPHDLP